MKKILSLVAVFTLAMSLVACDSGKDESSKTDDTEITIYIVRHGKTYFNTTGQVQGFSDSPLTDVGIEQADLVGDELKDVEFISAYSGGLGRQKDTAELILSKNNNDAPTLNELDGFKEWNYGGYEGKTDEEMWKPLFEQANLEFDENWTNYETLVEMLGDEGIADAIAANDELGEAETYEEITARGQEAMDQLIKEAEKNGGGNVLVVSSGSMIPTILTLLVPDQYNGESISNCSITILKYKNGKYTLETVNDTSHLE